MVTFIAVLGVWIALIVVVHGGTTRHIWDRKKSYRSVIVAESNFTPPPTPILKKTFSPFKPVTLTSSFRYFRENRFGINKNDAKIRHILSEHPFKILYNYKYKNMAGS